MKTIAAITAIIAHASAACVDMTWGNRDSTNDGCEWYDRYPSGCGQYNTDSFFSENMCCACGGGLDRESEEAVCSDTNNGIGDLTGDKCDWYTENPTACGMWDTEEFIAS